MSQTTARLPGEGWHLSISPTTLARQFLPVLTTRLAHLADAQSEREATASQSGEMQGKATPLHFSRKVMLDGIARGGAA